MILTMPLTGKVLIEGNIFGAGDLTGDANDPVRPIDIDLGNVSWKVVSIDLDAGVMAIDVTPVDVVPDGDGQRAATEAEKLTFLEYAQGKIEPFTKEQLYAQSGNTPLQRPF